MSDAQSLTRKLAAFFRAQPNVWHDGRTLGAVAGSYAWRTRVSELRRSPFNLDVKNRLRRCRRQDGSVFVVSEYLLRTEKADAVVSGAASAR